MATLLVGRSSTDCSNCRRGAITSQKVHDLEYGYFEGSGKVPGCGAVFTHIVSTYIYPVGDDGMDMGERWCRDARPDLEYGSDDIYTIDPRTIRRNNS